MSKKKLPLSADSHPNSAVAYLNLMSAFPEHWKTIAMQDQLSGIEYGQDWLVQITNDKNALTGAEFRVQSKVLERERDSRRISDDIKVSTLNLLSELPLPVMLHFYDKLTGTGYWMWFDEWYSKNYSDKMERQKTAKVSIPKKNVFDIRAIDRITRHVILEHQRSTFLKKANAATRTNSDYGYQAFFDTNSMGVGVYAKHKNAPPLSFVIQVDESGATALNRATERGEAVTVEAHVEWNKALPEFLVPEAETFKVTAIPHINERYFPASLEYFGKDDASLTHIPYVEFRLVQEGSVYRRWEGSALDHSVICIMEEDNIAQTTGLFVRRNKNVQTLDAMAKFFKFKRQIVDARTTIFKNLVTGNISEFSVTNHRSEDLSPDAYIWERLVDALLQIREYLHITIDVPDTLNGEAFWLTELVAEAVSTGRTYKRLNWLDFIKDETVITGSVNKQFYRQVTDMLQEGNRVNFLFNQWC